MLPVTVCFIGNRQGQLRHGMEWQVRCVLVGMASYVGVLWGKIRYGRLGEVRCDRAMFVMVMLGDVGQGRYGIACHGELSSVSVVFVKARLGRWGRLRQGVVRCD